MQDRVQLEVVGLGQGVAVGVGELLGFEVAGAVFVEGLGLIDLSPGAREGLADGVYVLGDALEGQEGQERAREHRVGQGDLEQDLPEGVRGRDLRVVHEGLSAAGREGPARGQAQEGFGVVDAHDRGLDAVLADRQELTRGQLGNDRRAEVGQALGPGRELGLLGGREEGHHEVRHGQAAGAQLGEEEGQLSEHGQGLAEAGRVLEGLGHLLARALGLGGLLGASLLEALHCVLRALLAFIASHGLSSSEGPI